MGYRRHVQEEHEYVYQGPVYFNSHLRDEYFEAHTIAVSTKEALNNIKTQYKDKSGLSLSCRIDLSGNLEMIQSRTNEKRRKRQQLPPGQMKMRFDDEME